MKVSVKHLKKLIKEVSEEQGHKEKEFDKMIHNVDSAVDKFTSYLIRQNTSTSEYKEYMEKLNKVLTGLKQINMSKVSFLDKNKTPSPEEPKLGQKEEEIPYPPSLKGGTGH